MVGRTLLLAIAVVCGLCTTLPISAQENAGQADLDKAVDMKLDAENMEDLGKVAELCEEALKKGLNQEDQAFAKQLLTSVRYQRAEAMAKGILEEAQQRKDWKDLRTQAVAEVDKGLKYDDTVGALYFLKARLLMLPDGNKEEAKKSIDRAVELLKENGEYHSKALVTSLAFTQDPEKQLEILSEAIKSDPNNVDAYRLRGILYLQEEKYDEALADLKMVTEQLAPGDLTSLQAYAETLAKVGKIDEALGIVNKVIQANPNSPIGYLLRARLKLLAGNLDSAIEDLDQVLVRQPRSVPALLMRASLYVEQEDYQAALRDVERALAADTGNAQALLMRASLNAQEGKYSEAIRDFEALLIRDASNVNIRLQLGSLYQLDKRPRKAVEVFDAILKEQPDNINALRGKADALLSYGKHAEAVANYEAALKIEGEDRGGTLNNLAWVLATSPLDDVRNGDKALQYGIKACEATDYQQAHILSTLAAAYAEKGDFEAARKWSKEAVKLAGDDESATEIREHLKNELSAYEKNEPWREIQNTKEGGAMDTIAGPASEVEAKLKKLKQEKNDSEEKKAEPKMTEPAPDMAPVS
ncbi:hypothetical protein DTL42_08720 [Bremerella cremea]|uniref:Tetratricopeptide repeat protein n=1 Tax=Bremerella cremea TaxID=1031537 RepID=A0A368KTA2_9BACT|nr:tetratricopeptide repeat protein [Bremerella cremea]RCS52900.1 hypothetical protein DTL42_08720 [Bremerella cremea]